MTVDWELDFGVLTVNCRLLILESQIWTVDLTENDW